MVWEQWIRAVAVFLVLRTLGTQESWYCIDRPGKTSRHASKLAALFPLWLPLSLSPYLILSTLKVIIMVALCSF